MNHKPTKCSLGLMGDHFHLMIVTSHKQYDYKLDKEAVVSLRNDVEKAMFRYYDEHTAWQKPGGFEL